MIWVIVLLYFATLLGLSVYFRAHNTTVADFLHGSGRMPWLWVGVSAFVSVFSASSFTIVAGRAYTDGYSVLIVYWASALAFVCSALYAAPKMRQLRIANPVEAVRMRFGPANEKFLGIISVPVYLIFPGLWLNGLAVFISGALGINTMMLILIVGAITIAMSALGGSWAVVSSDFVQFIIIATVSIGATVIALTKLGGVSSLVAAVPPASIVPNNMHLVVFALWAAYMSMQKIISHNCIMGTLRFNAVSSSSGAKKAAWLVVGIYVIGSLIWFVPAWASSVLLPDLNTLYPELTRPHMAAYLAFIQSFMPAGVLGLVVCALFAATMSSIDSSLTWCSGFIIKSFYTSHNNAQKSTKHVGTARFYTVVFGVLVILMALYYETLRNTSLFDLTYKLITYAWMPIAIPMLLIFWIQKTPDWSFPASVAIGIVVSLILGWGNGMENAIERFVSVFGYSSVESRNLDTIALFVGLLAQICITGGFFVLSQVWFHGYSHERAKDVQEFYRRLSTPVKNVSVETPIQKRIKGVYVLATLVFAAVASIFFLPLPAN